jgi:hypothetical protein
VNESQFHLQNRQENALKSEIQQLRCLALHLRSYLMKVFDLLMIERLDSDYTLSMATA